ncbi:hypothetical protein HCU40_17015 [Pseudanabaena biceps]|nr:hypothetical protein [Pseudanabaena biceps]
MSSNKNINDEVQTLVVAGNYAEYLNWRKENPIIKNCRYVERVEDVQGMGAFLANIVLYGSYENNSVYNTRQMKKLLAERNSPFRAYIN